MRAFLAASGTVFAIVCAGWATRLILGTPVRVNSFDVPVALSIIPMLITGGLAFWAFRLLPRAKAEY
jgi:hypothetical protein